MHNKTLWHTLLVMLCVLVFFFALHAKTAVYTGGAPAKVTPSTSSKLWLSGQKLEVQSVENSRSLLFWVVVLCLFSAYLRGESVVPRAFQVAPARTSSLRYIHRFLRPPPLR
jgi:hypothetical protein